MDLLEVLHDGEGRFRSATSATDREVALAISIGEGGLGEAVLVAIGGRDHVRVTPAGAFRRAVATNAAAVVLAHNHLDDFGPSAADLAVTRRLVAAGHLLGVPLIAHLVCGPAATHDLVGGSCWPSPSAVGLSGGLRRESDPLS